MNKQRRSRISGALDILKEVMEEEEEAFGNLPENLQEGTRGDEMQEGIDVLQAVIDELEEFGA